MNNVKSIASGEVKLLDLVENRQTSEFYPTPEKLADKMLSGIDWGMIETILEPSAGKGNLLEKIAIAENLHRNRLDVDCIEIDPSLRQILKYNFSQERKDEVRCSIREIENKVRYDSTARKMTKLSAKDRHELLVLQEKEQRFFKNGIHVVFDDFLSYKTYKKYSLIIMNPPFSDGDKHLLKALEMQKHGGSIICLLNAETIRNPYTATRKELRYI